MKRKAFQIILVLCCMVIVIHLILLDKVAAKRAMSKQDSDAYAISAALREYKELHNGRMPGSISDLDLASAKGRAVDTAQFKLVPIGTKGTLNENFKKDVWVQAKAPRALGEFQLMVKIFVDGDLSWEHESPPPD